MAGSIPAVGANKYIHTMHTLILALAMFLLPAGTEVVLKPYSTIDCPVVPFDADQSAHVNEHWIVIETQVIQHNGVNYSVLRLSPRFPTNPPTGLYWPESAVKLSLPFN